jgi:hypothetical protein
MRIGYVFNAAGSWRFVWDEIGIPAENRESKYEISAFLHGQTRKISALRGNRADSGISGSVVHAIHDERRECGACL